MAKKSELDKFLPPVFGPRNWVVSQLLGETPSDEEFLRDTPEWVGGLRLVDVPELWVDKIHDHVGEELADI